MKPTKSDLPQGTLDLLILKVVALGPVHGYAIAQRLDQVSRGVVQVPQGSLYPALHRLDKSASIASLSALCIAEKRLRRIAAETPSCGEAHHYNYCDFHTPLSLKLGIKHQTPTPPRATRSAGRASARIRARRSPENSGQRSPSRSSASSVPACRQVHCARGFRRCGSARCAECSRGWFV